MSSGPWQLLAQGIQDTTGHFVGRRDRDHGEHREDHFRAQDRLWFLRDRKHAERFASMEIQRRVRDAKAAGLHPLAALGVNPSSGVSFQHGSSNYQAPSTYYPKYSPVDVSPPSTLEKAQARLMNAQASLFEKQALDSDMARIRQAVTPDKLIEDLVNPQRTTHVKVGVPVKSAPAFSDAQTYEDRYGELGGSAMGLINIPADALYNGFLVVRQLLHDLQKSNLFDDSVTTFNAR